VFGLDDKVIKQISQVFKKYSQIESVVIYGSRAKGNYKHGSDIDLTFKGADLDLSVIAKISTDLDDLLLPYTFDISIYGQIDNPELLDHIARVGKIFYSKGLQPQNP